MCGAAGVGGWDASACRGVLLCAPARPVGYSAERLSLRRCTCPLGPYTTLRDTALRGSRRRLWRAGAPILPGGGRGSSRVLIALLLVALVAAILAASSPVAAQTVPTGSEEAWSATLTAQDLGSGKYGCNTNSATNCNALLSDLIIRIGGRAYRVERVEGGNNAVFVRTVPPLPQGRVEGWQLEVDRGPLRGRSRYTLQRARTLFAGVAGDAFTASETVELTLYRPRADIVAEQVRKGATRSASACPGAVDAGSLWHCHGDAVFHAHGPDWSARHPAPGQAVRATGDPLARPPATEPSSAADKAKGFGNWHSHPDGRFHRHAGGH